MKRGFDILFALALMVPVLPVLALCALAIKLEDRGPVFYRQIRLGLGGVPFGMLKLRSMVVDADRIGGHATAAGDARITRVGRVLRKTSLDEVPQILNVLKGEMSFVGPRPDVPAQQGDYAPQDFAARVSVRPGITGLAQAVGRSALSAEERLRHDLDYVARPTLPHDLKIIWMTLRTLSARTN